MRKINLLIFLLFQLTLVFGQQSNILQKYNGDFEDGITHWRFFEVPNSLGSNYEFTNDAVNGNQAVKINFVSPDATLQDRGFDNWSAGVPVVAGTEYTVKASVKSNLSSGRKVSILLGFFKSDGSVISPQYGDSFDLSNTYTEHTLKAIAPNDAATCWIAFRMKNNTNQDAAGTLYIDNVKLLGKEFKLEHRVMETTLPTNDVPIAGTNVVEEPYFAKNDGSIDATEAFQKAIDHTATAGGGVVFVPAGKYKFDGNLVIPDGVILRGEWKAPTDDQNVEGTVLMPFANKGYGNAEPFVSIDNGSGITNLSIWYPEQDINSVSPYPWTIHCHPERFLGPAYNASVINVTLVNAYQGIKIGPKMNTLHLIRNVYGTPLKQGLWLSQTVDIGRLINVNFTPKYWSGSNLAGAPSESAILAWLGSNSTVGVTIGRSDWEYLYDVKLTGYETGVKLTKYSDIGANGVIYGLQVEKSKIGIDLDNLNPYGWAITKSTFNVEGENSACIKAGDNFSSIAQFNSCSFGGNPQFVANYTPVSTGRLSFQSCHFQNWGSELNDPAINCIKGSVSLMGCKFDQNRQHVSLGENAVGAQLLDNEYPDELIINNQSSGEVIVSNEPLGLDSISIPSHVYAAEPRPLTDNMYNVVDFGAIDDGVTDNTSAFQSALNKAAQDGGGTVYIPAGRFRINTHLTVPTGVELRGIWDVPHHTTSYGSIIYAIEGKNNASGTPFISLESGAGIRGLTVWYPEQSPDEFYPYPWTIQSLGENCWIKDVTLGNPYQGVDFGSFPSDGHIVSYLAAAPIKTGIKVDKSSGEGWLEYIHFNPTYWGHTTGYPINSDDNAQEIVQTIIAKTQSALNAFQFGALANEHVLGTFVYGPHKGIHTLPNDGNSNINVFLHGTDGASNGVYLESKAGSEINFINTQLVTTGNQQNGIITTSSTYSADANFYNVLSWGQGENAPSLNRDGDGNLHIQQYHSKNGTFDIKEGRNRIYNVAISSSPGPQYRIGTNIDQLKLFGSFSKNGFSVTGNNTNKSKIELDYNYKQVVKGTQFSTGWENGDLQTSWDNMLFGNQELTINQDSTYLSETIVSQNARNGQFVLEVEGQNTKNEAIIFKVLDINNKILEEDKLSYWLRANDEGGKFGYIDLLFMDGTRFSELEAVKNEQLSLTLSGLNIGEWKNKVLPIGQYAVGKVIQTVLVQSAADAGIPYNFYIDDIDKGIYVSANSISKGIDQGSLTQVYPNPVKNKTNINFIVNQGDHIKITLKDLSGKIVSILADKTHYVPGEQKISCYLSNIPAGIYILNVVKNDLSGGVSIDSQKIIKI